MAILKDEEKEQGQGTSQALGQAAPQQEQQAGQAPQLQAGTSAPSRIGASTAPVVKAMPKQQKAGTGTFANLKSYLQAAQSGGQQKVAQAATQQVQKLGAGAQKGIQQAQQTFGRQMEAGSLKDRETAAEEAANIVGTARETTYQAPQPTAAPKPQDYLDRTGNLNEAGLAKLGDKSSAFQEELDAINRRMIPMDHGPGSANERAGIQKQKDREALYEKYGLTQPAQPQVPAQPQQYFSPEQQQRFAEIINAQYQGPQSIQQAGLYEQAAQKARTAQQAAERTQTALGREQLLKDVFGRGRDYSRGASKLDALLLNTAQQGVGELQKQGEEAGAMQQRLQQAQTESTNLATGRARDISNIQQEARRSFLEGRAAEETGTESRIDKLVKEEVLDASGKKIPKLDMEGKPIVDSAGNPVYQTQWDQLPEYFRDVVRNREANNQKELDRRVAEYNASTPQVTQDQLNAAQRQVAVAKSQYNRLKKNKRSTSSNDLNKAVESLKKAEESLSSLSAQKTAYDTGLSKIKQGTNLKALNLSPEEAAILGVSSGEGLYNELPTLIQDVNAERSRLISKDELARQQALARLAGLDTSKQLQKDLMYTDMEKAGSQTLKSSLNTEAVRKALNEAEKGFREAAAARTERGEGSKKNKTSGKRYYAAEEANIKDLLSKAGYDFNAPLNEQIGNMDISGNVSFDKDPNAIFEANVSGTGVLQGIGNILGSPTGSQLGDALAGLFGGGSSSKESKSVAASIAREDLKRRVQDYLNSQGFSNRAKIASTEETTARSAALQDLLKRQG